MGVWIETSRLISIVGNSVVTPRVGVWIETADGSRIFLIEVTPRVGVWIET